MLIKAGVDISRLNREIRRALPKIEKVCKSNEDELVITSTYEGTHGAGSLHYSNDAVDIREEHFTGDITAKRIKKALGSSFDVVLEGDHIHIEYDPK